MSGEIIPFFLAQRATKEITPPALFSPDAGTARRVLEFFTVNIRNPHTRKAYGKAAGQFAAWCEAHGITHLRDVQPIHVAAYVEELPPRERLLELGAAAAKRETSIVLLRGGTSRAGRGAAAVHTGSRPHKGRAGSDALRDGAIIEAESLDELV